MSEQIPNELIKKDQWVLWGPDKAPLQPNKQYAKVNDPQTWSSFDQVMEAYKLNKEPTFVGIGYVFSYDDGLIGIDIDECFDKDGNLVAKAEELIDLFASYTEISPSGDGLHVIGYGHITSDIPHKNYSYDEIKQVEIYDRGRFFTVTGNVFNGYSDITSIDLSKMRSYTSSSGQTRSVAMMASSHVGGEDQRLLNRIQQSKKDKDKFEKLFDNGDASDYLSESEADMALTDLLANYAGFDVDQIDRLFRNSKLYRPKWDEKRGQDNTYGRQTIDKVLKDKRFTSGSNKEQKMKELKSYLAYFYNIKRNEVTGGLEVFDQGHWRSWNDKDFNSLWAEIQLCNGNYSNNYIETTLGSDIVPVFDPFVSYFKSLPTWDRKTDYINHLAQIIPTDDHPEFVEMLLRKWLVGAVGCSIDEDVQNQHMLVLYGPQATRKTTFIERLLPRTLKYYFHAGQLDPSHKDSEFTIAENFLIDLDELEKLNKKKEADLKSLITRGRGKQRRPYGKGHETVIRRASFAGSTNFDTILYDDSGSRRYFIINITDSIPIEKMPDMDNVYSQAYALYKDDYQYWLDHQEQKQVEQSNLKYQHIDVVEQDLLQNFTPIKPDQAKSIEVYTVTEVAKRLYPNNSNISSRDLQSIGKAMKKHFTPKNRKSNVRRYYAIQNSKYWNSVSPVNFLEDDDHPFENQN